MSHRQALVGVAAIVLVTTAAMLLVQWSTGGSGDSYAAALSAATAPGANLIENGSAQVGAVSVRGWDAVTIPGWRVLSGLPTVVRSGTPGFPVAAGMQRQAGGGLALFAGGAGGTARLEQLIRLRSPGGQPLPGTGRYTLSAALGGTASSRASLLLTLLSSTGRVLGRRQIASGPSAAVTGHVAGGALPAGTAAAKLTLVLATTLRNIDGPNAPVAGYDRAVASKLRFSTSVAVQPQPALRPPDAQIPHFDHVFVFYFENEDYRSVIGQTKRAPYINSLLPHASVLADFFAEEHPSDGNYLALAGGSTFGIPLTDPLEENPLYTIHAPYLGAEIDAAHETWADFLQSAEGPCDDTVHGYYWNDDLPELYFAGVRDRPAYCAAHVLPLEALASDLRSTATTPNFAWIGANDCDDMEGCGIRAGDRFLQQELEAIMRSPAWRTQRSLAIITFDEDGYDHQHPPQRVPTIILGSHGVRGGYVSHVRYTHYSLLRTIEAALGLGRTLTANDRWAQPVADVFAPGASDMSIPARVGAAVHSRALRAGDRDWRSGRGKAAMTAFVANSAAGTVTPIDLANRRAQPAIRVGADPQAIAVTPDGSLALVADGGSDSVTPIDTITDRAGPPIPVGADPSAIAITPDGSTAFVADSGSDAVTPIDIGNLSAGKPIAVGSEPRTISIAPGGGTAFVLNWGGSSVTPIDTMTDSAGAPIAVGSYPVAIAFAPNGMTAYVANFGSDTVTPLDLTPGASPVAGSAIPVGQAPDALAVAPGGGTLDVVDGDSDTVTPIKTATLAPGRPVRVGYSPAAIAFSDATGVAYAVNTISGTVTPIRPGSPRAGHAISVGSYSYPLGIVFAPGTDTAVVLDTYSGQATLIDTKTDRASTPITTGAYPVAVAIGG